MTVNFKSAGIWRTAADVWFNQTGTWRRAQQVWRNVAGTWQKVHQISVTATLAVTASPTSFSAYLHSQVAAGSFSQNFVATASGGTGPYTYAWARIASGTDLATLSGTSTATLNSASSWPQHAIREYSETYQVTATDAAARSATFNVTLYVNVADNT